MEFIRLSSLPDDLAEDIIIAAFAHDVARNEPDHASASAKWLEKETEMKLDPKRKTDIVWAVGIHSIGLAKIGIPKAVERKHIIAGYLVLADHSDALGMSGGWRLIESQRYKEKRMGIVSSKIPVEVLRKMWNEPRITVEIEEMDLKNDSVAAHMIYNYLATRQIVSHIQHLLSEDAQKVIRDLMFETAEVIESLILFQENVDISNP